MAPCTGSVCPCAGGLSACGDVTEFASLTLQKIFRTTMLFQFVNVLLQVLVHKSHDLLQEEIGIAIYNMASVDFDSFYSAFLTEFLASCDGVDSNQKHVLGRNFKMDRVRGNDAVERLPLGQGQACVTVELYQVMHCF